jgi:hypothetical protein
MSGAAAAASNMHAGLPSNNPYSSNQIEHITQNIVIRQQNSGQNAF